MYYFCRVPAFLSVVLICWGFIVANGHCQQLTERKAIRQAEMHIEFYEYRNAINLLTRAVKIYPNSPEINELLAECYVEVGQKAKAYPHIVKSIRGRKKPSVESVMLYAKVLHHKLKLDSALHYYNLASFMLKDNDPDKPEIALLQKQCEHAKSIVKLPLKVKIENMGKNINTKWPEYCPVVNGDETKLFFTSRRNSNMGKGLFDGLPYEDIYVSKYANNVWTYAENGGKLLNTEQHDATVNLSPDGATFLLYREGDLYYSYFKGQQWTNPVAFGPPIFSTFREPSATISADGNTMYLVRDDYTVANDQDIYICRRNPKTGEWTEPQALGPAINTPYDDSSPYLHPDGKTMYFSSKGHNSIGGFDIFVTTLQEDGSWSTARNIGYPINTPDDDIWFVVSASGEHAYYSSAQEGGFGEEDIYKVYLKPSPDAPPAIPTPALTLLKGRVMDAKAYKPIEAKIIIRDLNTQEFISQHASNSFSGEYMITLPAGRAYDVSFQSKGFVFQSLSFDLSTSKDYYQQSKDIGLEPLILEVGKRFILQNIFYDFNKSTLRPQSESELTRLLNILQLYPNMRIKILGHTDNVGSDEYNKMLSHDRAKSVVDYLTDKGIEGDRLSWEGLGESQPIDSNETEKGRQINRRTEFEIISL
jgi:outer membrane protein OmpA-like peptidoglycan-associated protein